MFRQCEESVQFVSHDGHILNKEMPKNSQTRKDSRYIFWAFTWPAVSNSSLGT